MTETLLLEQRATFFCTDPYLNTRINCGPPIVQNNTNYFSCSIREQHQYSRLKVTLQDSVPPQGRGEGRGGGAPHDMVTFSAAFRCRCLSSSFRVVFDLNPSPTLSGVLIVNALENNLILSPSSCPRTLTTTRLDHPCVSTSLTRDQTTSRRRLQTKTNKRVHLSMAAT